MSTRGAIGFVVDGKTKAAYNHSDSYPSWLGKQVATEALALSAVHSVEELRQKVRDLYSPSENEKPSEAQKLRAKEAGYMDLGVSERSEDDWYCVLRNAQGSLKAALDLGILVDATSFLNDSLFCEHAYLLNLDGEVPVLEYYRGFQTKPHNEGRYAAPKPKGWRPSYAGERFYYPVALVLSIPVNEIEDADSFVVLCEIATKEPEALPAPA